MRENIYKIDDILIKTGKWFLILFGIFSFGGYCGSCLDNQPGTSFMVEIKKDGKREFIREQISDLSVKGTLIQENIKYLRKEYPKKEVSYDEKTKQIAIDDKNGKIEYRELNEQFLPKIKHDLIKSKYPKLVAIRELTDEERAKIENAALKKFGIIFLIGGGAGIAFLIVGLYIRKIEEKALSVYHILEKSFEAPIKDILYSTGLDEKGLSRVIQVLNSRGLTSLIWDSQAERIVDSRLKTQLIFVERCPSCGNYVNQKVSLDLNFGNICSYCNNPFPVHYLNELKLERIEKMKKEDWKNKQTVSEKKQSEFSLIIFFLLSILFFPAAIVYAIRKGGFV
ncbi:MAG: hypothetical protein KDK45_20775 [Leptospiraceae bacterium]|nr:hypothetical protein [Leptospiraceae bacterium]